MIAEELWKKLEFEGAIRNSRVRKALVKVKREEYVPLSYRKYAYMDTPLPIGHDQTISAPHIVALMTSLLKVLPGQKILEVGSGSGYQTAILLQMLGGKGKVFSVERLNALVEMAKQNLLKQEFKNYKILKGDGHNGLNENKPYDRIIVSASAKKIPEKLLKQLKKGGLLIIPVGNELLSVRKDKKGVCSQKLEEYVNFVPLVEN
ncbi:MAG: protein-L-isoaspartate(D-aspartate) O-methyltransferase [Nanoarchaeota archaeon]|nr:protein-L-isoaspartate(D-aspartate) O-methyltransferase [Nanoarchaeota archaeon]